MEDCAPPGRRDAGRKADTTAPSGAASGVAFARAAGRLEWVLLLALVLLLLQSAFWAPGVPWSLRAVVAAATVLAAFRPADALLVVAAFAPLSYVMVGSIWDAYPFELGQALALGFMAGYLWQRRGSFTDARPPADGLDLSARFLVLVVLASCAVQIVVVQALRDHPMDYAPAFLRYLVTEYLAAIPEQSAIIDGRRFITTAAILLEGVGLMLCARRLCTETPVLRRRLTYAVVLAGVAAAALGFSAAIHAALSGDQAVWQHRWSSAALPSVDSAGGYFMLVAFVALGLAFAAKPRSFSWLPAAALCFGAMWLTKTRSAVVASLVVATATGLWLLVKYKLGLRLWQAVSLIGLSAAAVGIVIVLYNPFHILAPDGRIGRTMVQSTSSYNPLRVLNVERNAALGFRLLFAETAIGMIRSRPFFGVGVGRYWALSHEFSSPQLRKVYSYSNAHNNFLWHGAELGLVGLAAFLWLLGAAAARMWSEIRARPADAWLIGVVTGLAAFVVTWLSWQVLFPQVAFTFWILVGIAVSGRTGDSVVGVVRGKRPATVTVALVAASLFVMGSVPVRARRDVAQIDFATVAYGFHDVEFDNNQTPFRWVRPHSSFFVPRKVDVVVVPIAAFLNAGHKEARVAIRVRGRLAYRMTLTDTDWHRVQIHSPGGADAFWQVDIEAEPGWVPSRTLADSTDDRLLTVRVGEIVPGS